MIAEMVGRGSGFGTTFGAQTSIGLLPILYLGSEELKNEWIPEDHLGRGGFGILPDRIELGL